MKVDDDWQVEELFVGMWDHQCIVSKVRVKGLVVISSSCPFANEVTVAEGEVVGFGQSLGEGNEVRMHGEFIACLLGVRKVVSSHSTLACVSWRVASKVFEDGLPLFELWPIGHEPLPGCRQLVKLGDGEKVFNDHIAVLVPVVDVGLSDEFVVSRFGLLKKSVVRKAGEVRWTHLKALPLVWDVRLDVRPELPWTRGFAIRLGHFYTLTTDQDTRKSPEVNEEVDGALVHTSLPGRESSYSVSPSRYDEIPRSMERTPKLTTHLSAAV